MHARALEGDTINRHIFSATNRTVDWIMTNEEREIITGFIQRVGGGAASSGSVPAPALPPVDREADALIGDLFARLPEAKYRLTQTAFVQEHALVQAQNRIKQLEFELDQAKRNVQAAPQPSRGFLGGLFGGGQSAAPPPPQYQQPQYAPPPPPPPQYAPGYQPGMFQRSGSGFLGSALTTAAGVAGGMVVGNALMDLFEPHHGLGGGLGGGFGGGFGGSGETVNVFPNDPAAASPWSGGANQGSAWDNQTTTPDPGNGGWGGNSGGGSAWDNSSSSDTGGGWDSSGGGFDDSSSGGGFDNI
jgi:hypothetical protein